MLNIVNCQAQNTKILAFGDSLTAGYLLEGRDAFPSQLEARLKNVSVINAGVSGDTTNGGLERLEWSLTPDIKAVILELGANDALRGLSPEVTYSNLDKIITQLKAKNIKILLCGMLAAPNMGKEYEAKFNGIYKTLSEKHAIPLYPFFLEGVVTKSELLLSDGMHPNPKGVRVIVNNILPFVEELVMSVKN